MDTYYKVEQIIHIMISEDEINVFLELYFFVKYSKLPIDYKYVRLAHVHNK